MSIPPSLYSPIKCISPNASAYTAANQMVREKIGALAVIEKGQVIGVLSERDLMLKVLHKKIDPEKTKVRIIMSKPAITVTESTELDEVIDIMEEKRIRHIPLLDKSGKPIAMLSMRTLFTYRIDELNEENESLSLFLTADGIGG